MPFIRTSSWRKYERSFQNEKEDFADHGERVVLDDEGIKFECLTKPYGFVSPDSEVWF